VIFERFTDDGLSQYSYLLASEATGEAAVVDPRRDVEVYLRYARERGLRIAHVLETHIHADYASGALDLAERTGARLYLSAYDEGEVYDVSFPHEPLRDGDEVPVGKTRLVARHTPGHTPEHLSFLVHEDGAAEPSRFLTGDFLFVGSLGRPDLLGEESKRELAASLFDSVRESLSGLPDAVRIHPGHGSGSMCGSGMSTVPETTLGRERAENPYLDPSLDRDTFVARLLASLPPYPDYYRRMKERNAGGRGFTLAWPEPVALGVAAFAERAAEEAVIVDVRHQLAFGGGHIPGAFGIGLDPDLSAWAGWVLPPDRPLLLVAERRDDVMEAVTRLTRVGFDRVDAFLEPGIDAWLRKAYPLQAIPQVQPNDLARRLRGDATTVVDVRTDDEYRAGHIEGAVHVMGGWLPEPLDRLPDRDRPIAVICGSGYRSTVVASVLQRCGYTDVWNVPGGMTAWEQAGLPVVRSGAD